jgi:DNA-binding XRE family transcriptional regulator
MSKVKTRRAQVKRARSHLPAKLRELREKSGLTLEEAAKRMGLNKTFLCNCEQGRYPFPVSRLAAAMRLYSPKMRIIESNELVESYLSDLSESQQ